MSTIHIGRWVERLVEEKPMKKNVFAKAMNYSPTNISSLFAREDWHVGMVEQAGRATGFNAGILNSASSTTGKKFLNVWPMFIVCCTRMRVSKSCSNCFSESCFFFLAIPQK